jgi:hypothetical protein
MVVINKIKKIIIGKYISGAVIKSIAFGAFKLSSIIFSKPLPMDTTKKDCGIVPIKIAKK